MQPGSAGTTAAWPPVVQTGGEEEMRFFFSLAHFTELFLSHLFIRDNNVHHCRVFPHTSEQLIH